MFERGDVQVAAVDRTAADDLAVAHAFARSHVAALTMAQDLAVTWALAHPEAARLASARPGPDLAWRLADLAVADAPRDDLLEAIGAWDRLAAWVTSQQARVVQELQARAAGSTWAAKTVREEIAATLAISGRAAGILTDRARELTAAPEVHDALDDGRLSARKADVLLAQTGTLTPSQARQVHTEVIADAPLLTAPQVRDTARDLVLRLDPRAAEARHAQARADRSVTCEPAPDCMAIIRAYLPADDAMQVMRGLDAVAATAASEDPRATGARRADALVDILATVLHTGLRPDGTPLHRPITRDGTQHIPQEDAQQRRAQDDAPSTGRPTRRRRHRPVRLNLTISTDALADAATAPGHLDGYGPVVPSIARRLAAEAAWHFQRTDPATGEALEQPHSRYRPPEALREAIIARDVTCTFPGCRTGAWACDLDHTVPFDDRRDASDQTRRSNLAALCRHHHNLKTHGGWTPQRDPATGITTWTSPAGKPYTREPIRAPGSDPDPRTTASPYATDATDEASAASPHGSAEGPPHGPSEGPPEGSPQGSSHSAPPDAEAADPPALDEDPAAVDPPTRDEDPEAVDPPPF